MSQPWMPLYIADYLADTGHLTAAEHGAYLLLIMHYWRTGSLPADEARLARIARMNPDEWAVAMPSIASFFEDGWKHGRIDFELAKAEKSHARRAEAGRKGGNSKSEKQCSSIATAGPEAGPEQSLSLSEKKDKKDSEPIGSGAEAPRDFRDELFKQGLQTLAKITGKTPDSCRSQVGRWLKLVNDEAIHVIGLIEDAARNRVADPVAWINKSLQARAPPSPSQRAGKPTLGDVCDRQLEQLRLLNEPPRIRESPSEAPLRIVSPR